MPQNVAAFEHYWTKQVPRTIEVALREALKTAAEKLVHDLKIRVPVYAGPETVRSDGSPIRPGALRDSIGWTWGDAPKGSLVLGQSPRIARIGGREGIKITIYAGNAEAFYARWVEFGTWKWAGSPFFFGTYRDHRRRIRGGITRALRKAIRELQ